MGNRGTENLVELAEALYEDRSSLRRHAGVRDRLRVRDDLDVLCAGEALWDLAPLRGQTLADAASLRSGPAARP